MANHNLTGKNDRESILKLVHAVNAAAFGEFGVALSCVSSSRLLSIKQIQGGEDEVFSALSTAVHCYIQACIAESASKSSEEQESIVYVLRDASRNSVKIGVTKNLKQRVSTLQTGCSSKLEVLKTVKGDSRLEQQIHSDLKDYRQEGEWFTECPFVLSYIDSLTKT